LLLGLLLLPLLGLLLLLGLLQLPLLVLMLLVVSVAIAWRVEAGALRLAGACCWCCWWVCRGRGQPQLASVASPAQQQERQCMLEVGTRTQVSSSRGASIM
jgi:hypothetical protein